MANWWENRKPLQKKILRTYIIDSKNTVLLLPPVESNAQPALLDSITGNYLKDESTALPLADATWGVDTTSGCMIDPKMFTWTQDKVGTWHSALLESNNAIRNYIAKHQSLSLHSENTLYITASLTLLMDDEC